MVDFAFGSSVYALDEATGALFWKHRVGDDVWGSPLVVDGKIYIGNRSGEVDILALGKTLALIAHHEFEGVIQSSLIFANGVLYVTSGADLFAIHGPSNQESPAKSH